MTPKTTKDDDITPPERISVFDLFGILVVESQCPICNHKYNKHNIKTFHHLLTKPQREKIPYYSLKCLGFDCCHKCHRKLHTYTLTV